MRKVESVKTKRSLSAKMRRTLILFAAVLSVSAFVLGLCVYIRGEINDGLDLVHDLSLTMGNTIDGDRLAPYTQRIMDEYYAVPRELHVDQYSEAYREHFADIHDAYADGELLPLLQNFLYSNNLANVMIVTPDETREPGTIVFLVNSDPSKALHDPGQWDYDAKQYKLFTNGADREDTLLLITHEGKGFACYGSAPIYTSEGEIAGYSVAGYFVTNVFSSALRFAFNYIILIVCLAALLTVLIVRRTRRGVVQPINAIAQAAGEYASNKRVGTREGSYFDSLNIRTGDEIENLSHVMAGMERDIIEYEKDLTAVVAEKERIGTELALATRIQADMLPNTYPAFPDRHEFDVYASMDPAKEVGGDFYDFFFVDDDHLCLLIADVSGKGVPAALFMMASRIIIASNAKLGMSPAETMRNTNEAICQNNREEMFVTVWLGILEISSGSLTAANAGHEYPVLMQPGRKFEIFKDKHSFVIGGMDGVKYWEYQMQLLPGARMFLYTDGVPEATNSENELFGVERMLDALNQDTDANPMEVLRHVRQAVDGFVGDAEQFDDLTMLCLKYNGPNREKA